MKGRSLYLIFLGGLILVVILTWSFLIPKFQQAWGTKQKLDQEEERLKTLKEKLSDLQGLNEFELSERTKISLKAVPAEKSFLEALAILGQAATDHSLILESFQVSPGELVATEKGKLVYKISLIGNAESFKGFLEDLGRTLPLLSPLGKLSLSLEEGNTTVSLTIEGDYLPLPKTLGKIEASVPKLTTSEEKYLNLISGFRSPAEVIIPQASGKEDPFSF